MSGITEQLKHPAVRATGAAGLVPLNRYQFDDLGLGLCTRFNDLQLCASTQTEQVPGECNVPAARTSIQKLDMETRYSQVALRLNSWEDVLVSSCESTTPSAAHRHAWQNCSSGQAKLLQGSHGSSHWLQLLAGVKCIYAGQALRQEELPRSHTFLWLINLPTGGSLMMRTTATDTAKTATPHMAIGQRQLPLCCRVT